MKRTMGFLPALCLLFIALKLCGVIDWCWFWVLSPIVLPFGFALTVLFALFLCAVLVAMFSTK